MAMIQIDSDLLKKVIAALTDTGGGLGIEYDTALGLIEDGMALVDDAKRMEDEGEDEDEAANTRQDGWERHSAGVDTLKDLRSPLLEVLTSQGVDVSDLPQLASYES